MTLGPAGEPLFLTNGVQPYTDHDWTFTLVQAVNSSRAIKNDDHSETTPALLIDVPLSKSGQLLEEAILGAIAQAKSSLIAQPSRSVLVQLPAGEFRVNTTTVPFELSDVKPAPGASLTIAGASGGATVLRFDGRNDVISGRNTSHVRFQDLTFGRQRLTTTQGVVVGADAKSLTLAIQDGYPTPGLLMADPERLQPGAGRWMRLYTEVEGGRCEIVTDASNGTAWPAKPPATQVKWLTAVAVAPDAASTIDVGSTSTQPPQRRLWRFGGLKWDFGRNSEPVYRAGSIVGVKSKHGGQAFFFLGGDDITFRRIVWTEHSRGVIRGGISNIEFDSCAVKKSTLAPAHGLGLCMATAGGGPQLGQPHDPAITGVVVRNHTSEGTGDDAVALFNVHDGEVSDCHISDSFARGILLYKSTARLSGNVLHRNPVWHDDHNMSTWD